MMTLLLSLLKRRKIQSIGLGLCLLFYCRYFLFQIQYLVSISTTITHSNNDYYESSSEESFIRKAASEEEKNYPTTTTTTTTTNSRKSPHYYYNDNDVTSGVNVNKGNNNNNNIGLLGSSYVRRVILYNGYYDSLTKNNKYNNSDNNNNHQHQHHRHHHVVQFPQTSIIISPPSDNTSSTTNYDTTSSLSTETEETNSWYEGHCHPIIEVKFRPTCNSIHELEFFDTTTTSSSSTTTTADKSKNNENEKEEIMNNNNNNNINNVISLLSTAGSWRSVWKYNEIINNNNYPSSSSSSSNITLTIKVLKLSNPRHPLNTDYNIGSYTRHNLDSFVYEQLSQSSHVVSSFGYCGQSIITEYANAFFGTVNNHYLSTFLDRIIVAQQLAHGLYELHTLQPILSSLTTTPTPYQNTTTSSSSSTAIQQKQKQSPLLFAHHDINPANLISINPTATNPLQWNDFNLGIITRKYYDDDDDDDSDSDNDQNITTANIINNDTGMCGVRAEYMKEKWRSPEIIRNYKSKDWIMNIHASDIYEFGNVLYCLLTKQGYPWRWNLMYPNNTSIRPSASQIGIWKSNGTLPKLPYRFWDEFDNDDHDHDHTYDKLHAMVLWEATKACYRYNPDERPTAWKLATALHIAHDWFLQLQQQQGEEKRQQDSAAAAANSSNPTTTQRKWIQPPSIKDIQELFN